MINLQEFIEREFVVNCKTKEEAKEFINMCENMEIQCDDMLSIWEQYKGNTCFSFTAVGSFNYLSYSDKDYFNSKGMKIIDYKELIKGGHGKTFKEVIEVIKEGDIWKNDLIKVYFKDGSVFAESLNDKMYSGFRFDTSLYYLEKDFSYSFAEAYNLIRTKNCIMESKANGAKYKFNTSTNKVIFLQNGINIENTMFLQGEIDDKWYVYEI